MRLIAGIRPAGAEDAPFLFALFRSTHEHEFAFLPPGQQEPVLRMQFEAQSRSYTAQFPNAQDWVILFGGQAAGRLLWCEQADQLRVVDIGVLAPFWNHGLGTYALGLAIQRAAELGKPLRLSVRQDNHAAQRLYGRLGFATIGQDLLYLEMEYQP